MIIPQKERLQIEVKAEQEKEHKLLKKYVPMIDGGSIFEYQFESGKLKKAEFVQTDTITLGMKPKRKLVTNKRCAYVEALNARNALKHLKKGNVILYT